MNRDVIVSLLFSCFKEPLLFSSLMNINVGLSQWLEPLHWVLGKDTLLSHYLSPPMRCSRYNFQDRVSKRNSNGSFLTEGGSVAEWSVCRTHNPAVPGSSPALATG